MDLQKAAEILRDCLNRGTSNAPIMNVAGIRRAKWLGKPLLGGPQGYAASAPETFRRGLRRSLSSLSTAAVGIARRSAAEKCPISRVFVAGEVLAVDV